MSFSQKLKLFTKDSHKTVDDHPFVNLIRTNEIAADIYITFNKICINTLQNTNYARTCNNKDFIQKIHRPLDMESFDTDFLELSESFIKLLDNCEKYPLEHYYMFILGLLMGGNLMKRFISVEHHPFLTFENNKETIMEFREILDNIELEKQSVFVNIVNESYGLIKYIFDEFYTEFF